MVTPVAKPVDKNNKKEKKQDKGGGGGGGGGSKEVSITKVILPHLFTHRTNTGTFITSQFVTNGKSNPHFLSHSLLTLTFFFPPCSPLQLNPWPGYIPERLSLYEELKKESDALLAKKARDSKPITVELPDGRKVDGKAWLTTPYQLACDIRSEHHRIVN